MLNILKRITDKKHFSITAQGMSMIPLLQPNDLLYFKKGSFTDIKVNNIIIIEKKRSFMVHRVTYKNNNYLITKGDNNLESDGRIYPNQIIAKVYQVKRKGGIFNPESFYLLQSTLYFQEIIRIKKIFEREKIHS